MRYAIFRYGFIALFFYSCTKAEQTGLSHPGTSSGSAIIVILGSSTAAGVGATPSDSSWVNRLRLTTLNNPKTLYFINLAVRGYSTADGLPGGDTAKNITKALSFHPSLVMISYPTNDISDGTSDDVIMGNYNEMIRLLDSAKVNYLIFGTQPRNFDNYTLRERLKTLNDKMESTFIGHFNDIYDLLATPDFYIKPALTAGDGTHLNNAGHYLIMESVLGNNVFQDVIK